MPLRILLADDQQMIREALAMILDLEIDLEVVKQVGRGDEVLPAVRETRPDVALLDIEMPGATGIEAAAELARSGLTSQTGRAGAFAYSDNFSPSRVFTPRP